MLLKGVLTSAFSIMLLLAAAQDMPRVHRFAHEISFTTENDAYLFRKHDAYYTNGIFLRFSAAGERNDKKIIQSYEAGQMIYTPLLRKTQTAADIDRPYCGYLFAKYSRTAFSKHDDLFQYNATIGVVGEASLGEDLQNGYHKLLGYGRFSGWQFQVQNAIGLDFGMVYAKTIWEDSEWAKLVPQFQASLGSNYTNAKLGTFVCIGAFEKNNNSALWNSRISRREMDQRRKSELFFYWYPEIIVQGYNATIQGGLFNKGTGAVLAEPERMMFQNSIGMCFAQERWTAKFAITFQDREAPSQKTPQQFGSFQLSYRMK